MWLPIVCSGEVQAFKMSGRKFAQAEFGGGEFRFGDRCRDPTHCSNRCEQIPIGCRPFIFRIAVFILLCVPAFICCGSEASRAQQSGFGVYARAVEYCRGDVKRPIALDLDKRVLCFDGYILPGQNISLAGFLEEGGLFVVRSPGGDILTVIALANLLRDRRATVVVYDYCLSACASYLLVASMKTFVLRDTLVAWHYTSDPLWCPSLVAPRDDGPKRLEKSPCPDAPAEIQGGDEYRRYLNSKFYGERVVNPLFDDPPESVTIRNLLRGMFEGTGRYPDVAWTWNPRYYASALKTKIVYEAYPNSQAEVDAMVSKLPIPRVLYDP